MMDIASHLFCSNPSLFGENYTDLLIFFNRNVPFPNQASWTVLSPYIAVSIKVVSVVQMKHFKMREWLQLKKKGLKKLVLLCHTFGNGALAIGCQLPEVSLVPHRFCRFCMLENYGGGKQVELGTVSGALSAVCKMVPFPYEVIPINAQGDKALVPRLAQTVEG